MKRPIAMKCTEKQFNAIKPKLVNKEILDIKFYPGTYLVNDYDYCGKISTLQSKFDHYKECFEEWNEKIFLEACGIETEKTFSITESQIKTLYDIFEVSEAYQGQDYLKEWFTESEAFESEVKLKVGKWYKETVSFTGKMFVYIESIQDKNNVTCYGFNGRGEWFDSMSGFGTHGLELATEQEVFEALKNEAVKRGFVGNQYVDITSLGFFNDKLITGGQIEWKEGYLNFGDKQTAIFKNGVWGKVLDSITLSEAEQQLGKKIIV